MAAKDQDDPVFARYRVKPGGKGFSLASIDPQEKTCFPDREAAEKQFEDDVEAIVEIQNAFYACAKKALLCVFQAMDAGGKDGTVRKVFGPVNPAGVRVTNFKKPSDEELAHDYLWRIHKAVPPRGMIGIFNRSHYEDVLVVKVFDLAPAERIEARYEQINAFEKHLVENDVIVLKFFLHISRDEQKERFQERLDEPHKHWKFNPGDLEVRKRWDDFQAASERAIKRCSTKEAPWYAIPANRNWYRNACVARIVRKTIEASELEPFVDRTLDAPLLPEAPVPGEVVKESAIAELGVTEWLLENGVRVILKPTDFKNDQVLLSAFSPGGHSLVDDEHHTSAIFATSPAIKVSRPIGAPGATSTRS